MITNKLCENMSSRPSLSFHSQARVIYASIVLQFTRITEFMEHFSVISGIFGTFWWRENPKIPHIIYQKGYKMYKGRCVKK